MPDGQPRVNGGNVAPTEKYIVPGLQRGLQILRCFNRNRRKIGAPELAKDLNIPRSTVFRLIQTLEHMGFLEKIEHGTDYRLGVGILSLGFEFIASLEVSDLARPIIDKLRDETGHSAHLAIRDGSDIIVVVKAAAPSTLASSVIVGTRLPAHGTILGRMILADLSDDELAIVYPETVLPKISPQTPTTLDDLKVILTADRARGFAISTAYFEAGVASVAAPVWNSSGRVVASINVTFQNGAVKRMEIDGIIVQAVRFAAAELSAQLGYRVEFMEAAGGET